MIALYARSSREELLSFCFASSRECSAADSRRATSSREGLCALRRPMSRKLFKVMLGPYQENLWLLENSLQEAALFAQARLELPLRVNARIDAPAEPLLGRPQRDHRFCKLCVADDHDV